MDPRIIEGIRMTRYLALTAALLLAGCVPFVPLI